MKNANRTMVVISSCVLLMSAGAGLAQDWPQWRGANRNAAAPDFKAPANWPQELAQQWKVEVGQGDATPALVGNKLYVFARQDGKEVTLCLNAETGQQLWSEGYDAQGATGPAARQHSGPRSSPAVAEGKVVTFGVRGTLSCLEAATGKKLWRKDDFADKWPRFFTASSPIIVNGLCIAQVGAGNQGGIIAYDLASGNHEWEWTEDGPGYASPVLLTVNGTAMVVTLTEKKIVGLGVADGKLLWDADFTPQGRAYNAATPIVEGQTIIYTGAGRGTKAVKIVKEGDAFTAKELWSNPQESVQFNTPVLHDGRLYGLSQNNDIFCIDAQDGKSAWTYSLGGRGGFGSIVSAGSVLMALTPQAELLVFQPSDKEYKELAKYKVADSETYAYPVPSGNRIYVKDQNSVILWQVK